jgi:TonB family protein
MMRASEASGEYVLLSFCLSLVSHIIIFAIFFLKLNDSLGDFTKPIVYSVSIEGGKTLGGRSQVPLKKEQTPVAPPKNVSGEQKVEEKTQPKPEPKKVEKADDAEVSLSEKTKPTPAPTAVSTPKPPKSEPKKAEKTATPKPTPKKQIQGDPNKELEKAMQRYTGESAEAGGKVFGAAVLGGKSMGGGTQRSAEFIAYYNLLRSHIKRGWRWYDTNSGYTAKASFRIDRDGKVSDIRLTQSSGSREFDDSVLRALAKADPVPPPPPREYENFKFLNMLFDPRE